MEKHIQTVILLVITGLLAWSGKTLVEMKETVSVMSYRMDNLDKKSDQYLTRDEADQRAKLRDFKIDAIEQRQAAMELRASNLEQHVNALESKRK